MQTRKKFKNLHRQLFLEMTIKYSFISGGLFRWNHKISIILSQNNILYHLSWIMNVKIWLKSCFMIFSIFLTIYSGLLVYFPSIHNVMTMNHDFGYCQGPLHGQGHIYKVMIGVLIHDSCKLFPKYKIDYQGTTCFI